MSHLAVTRFNWQFNSINNLIYSKKFDGVGAGGGADFWRGLYSEGHMYGGKFAFQIDWARL